MALESVESSAEAVSSASAEMIGGARESVVQVQSWVRGAGAGVIWAEDGLVLTNHHVVAGGRRGVKVGVVLHDGRAFDAEVARCGRDLDLALLRIKDAPDDLPTTPFGDSDKLRLGGLVYAIGHPWGRLGAVTAGIVSGLGAVRGPGGRARHIQSDVALAPGNSGGPLLNARGEVVGINAMIFGRLALSIPSNAAGAWLAGTTERRPRLGVQTLPVELPPFLCRTNPGTPEAGLMIAAIEDRSPAERAGLLVGDVLLGVGDETPHDVESVLDAIACAKDAVRLRVMRGGKISFVDVNLGVPGRAA
jgi:serine protease Do